MFNVKTLVLALGLGFAAMSAQAANLTLSADTNLEADAEQYSFGTTLNNTGSFSDIAAFTITPYRDIFASVSGSDGKSFKFTSFDLWSVATNSVVVHGSVLPGGSAKISNAELEGFNLAGDYFLKITGDYSGKGIGSGSYNGTITLTAPVPEPESYAMMLAGLGLMGFVARRRSKYAA